MGKASSGSSLQISAALRPAITFPWYLHSCFILHFLFKLFRRRKDREGLLSDCFLPFPVPDSRLFACVPECWVLASSPVLPQRHTGTDGIASKHLSASLPIPRRSLAHTVPCCCLELAGALGLHLSAPMFLRFSHRHILAKVVAFILVSPLSDWPQQEVQYRG